MATRATAEQFYVCGLKTVDEQLRLATPLNSEVTDDDRDYSRVVTFITKTRSGTSKATVKKLTEKSIKESTKKSRCHYAKIDFVLSDDLAYFVDDFSLKCPKMLYIKVLIVIL